MIRARAGRERSLSTAVAKEHDMEDATLNEAQLEIVRQLRCGELDDLTAAQIRSILDNAEDSTWRRSRET